MGSIYRTESRTVQTQIEVKVIECSVCGKKVDIETRNERLPVGWLIVEEQQRQDWTVATPYCSKVCLVRGNAERSEDEQMTDLGRTAFASVQA